MFSTLPSFFEHSFSHEWINYFNFDAQLYWKHSEEDIIANYFLYSRPSILSNTFHFPWFSIVVPESENRLETRVTSLRVLMGRDWFWWTLRKKKWPTYYSSLLHMALVISFYLISRCCYFKPFSYLLYWCSLFFVLCLFCQIRIISIYRVAS